MSATCLVNETDYQRHWGGRGAIPQPVATWAGEERRIGLKDRRSGLHERRWEACKGRRHNVSDRRNA